MTSSSSPGENRGDAIFQAMLRAGARRRLRRRVLQSGSAVAAIALLALAARFGAAPPPTRGPQIAVDAPSPPPAAPVVRDAPPPTIRADYVAPAAGIAERRAAPPPTFAARTLSDADLQSVLAEDGAYAITRVRGQVFVMTSRPPEAFEPDHIPQ